MVLRDRQPLLFFGEVIMKIKTICIDPGHGGTDNGAVYGYAEEDDINLAVSLYLRCILEQSGFEIIMTRDKDYYVPLKNRCILANNFKADFFISIHCDAWHKETTSGISTHIYNGGVSLLTDILAAKIHQSLICRFPKHVNRGVRLSNFHVLRMTVMPAVLVECEFISNPDMREFLLDPENQFAIALAIARGVEETRK